MKVSPFWKGVLVSLALRIFPLHSYFLNTTKPLDYSHNDAYMVTFVIKHYANILSSGAWQDIRELPMFYSFKKTLLWNEHYGLVAAVALPIYFLTKQIVLAFNVTAILILFFSFAAMYTFVWYFTKSVSGSILSGLIFVLNPAIFTRFPDHTNLILVAFIPLIFLFWEKLQENPKPVTIFLFWLFLALQLLSSFYYAIFLTVLFPVYVFLRWWQTKMVPKVGNWRFWAGAMLFVAVAYGQMVLYLPSVGRREAKESGQRFLSIYSARISDYLFTSEKNIFWGGLKRRVKEVLPGVIHDGVPSEHSLFLGIIPFALVVLSFKVRFSTRQRNIRSVFIVLVLLSFLLSLGPQGGLYDLVGVLNPLFDFIRVPARWSIVVAFGVSVIAGLTLPQLVKAFSAKKKLLTTIFTVALLLIEYWYSPFGFLSISKETERFYAALREQKHIRVILDLPIANLIENDIVRSRAEYLDTHYLLWAAMFHDKKLLNGHTSFVPSDYYLRAQILTTSFPNLETLKLTRSWGVDGIILHRDEYNYPEQYSATHSLLTAFGVPLVYQTDNLALFDLTKWRSD